MKRKELGEAIRVEWFYRADQPDVNGSVNESSTIFQPVGRRFRDKETFLFSIR
jgi:hypothetical protein